MYRQVVGEIFQHHDVLAFGQREYPLVHQGTYSHLVIRSTEDEKAAGSFCLRLSGPLLHDWHHLLRALRAVVVESEVVPVGSC